MSIEVVSWALRVPVGGNAKIMLLGLANHAHPDGTEAYPSLNTLAEYGHCDRSTARRNLRKLADDGWISEDGLGPAGQTKYRLAIGGKMPRGQNVQGVASDTPPGVAPMPPEPSLGTVHGSVSGKSLEKVSHHEGFSAVDEKLSEPSRAREGEGAGARGGSFTHGRDKVSAELAESAERLLARFNEATGCKFKARKKDGRPTAELKQVAGAMLEREDVTEAQWSAGIRATGEHPPSWFDGRWIVGTMFGPKASAYTLSAARPVAIAASAGGMRPTRFDVAQAGVAALHARFLAEDGQ